MYSYRASIRRGKIDFSEEVDYVSIFIEPFRAFLQIKLTENNSDFQCQSV
jgi:hypothetical protein